MGVELLSTPTQHNGIVMVEVVSQKLLENESSTDYTDFTDKGHVENVIYHGKSEISFHYEKNVKMPKKNEEELNDINVKIDFKTIEAIVKHYGAGLLEVNVRIPEQIQHLASKSIQNFFKLPLRVQLDILKAYEVRGKFGIKKNEKGGFIFQMSKGGIQQIKEYHPEIYKNEQNTPLRVRTRMIMHLALKEPLEKRNEKLNELYRTYPYYLVKDEPVNLRLRNFYFRRYIKEGNLIKIYRLRDGIEGLEPDPQQDVLYIEKEYSPKKTVKFQYEGRDDENYYAVNERNGELSNVLRFVWKEELVVSYEELVVRQRG